MKFGNWSKYLFCPECGYALGKGHLLEVCPSCGVSVEVFEPAVARWVDTSVWWNPWTWDSGIYQKLGDRWPPPGDRTSV